MDVNSCACLWRTGVAWNLVSTDGVLSSESSDALSDLTQGVAPAGSVRSMDWMLLSVLSAPGEARRPRDPGEVDAAEQWKLITCVYT